MLSNCVDISDNLTNGYVGIVEGFVLNCKSDLDYVLEQFDDEIVENSISNSFLKSRM